jgi:2-polyprenyl-3-methyl-5-hydroxy-6-metoxy-1,4-benzoquinol methylase
MSARLPLLRSPRSYWEDRARRYARDGDGLAAVCSFGMPAFHNRAIDLCQRLALQPWIVPPRGARVLDVGCGVGRWTHRLAAAGAAVTGVDISRTMLGEARRRLNAAGLGARCRFLCEDLCELDLGEQFDLIVGVTVLQHIVDPARFRQALRRLAAHLAFDGRLVLLEAAPTHATSRCDSRTFVARARHDYLAHFARESLRLREIRGVDPAPFRAWLVPYLSRMPRVGALAALSAATALALPIDVPFGRIAARSSWHAVFVLEHAHGDCDAY